MKDWLEWALAAAAFIITVDVRAEVSWVRSPTRRTPMYFRRWRMPDRG
jgi:hypothetical protein